MHKLLDTSLELKANDNIRQNFCAMSNIKTDKRGLGRNMVHEDGVEVASISAIMLIEFERQRTMENV